MGFMQGGPFQLAAGTISGSVARVNTGGDGFEISVPASVAADLAEAITATNSAIGLGARFCCVLSGPSAHGHDLDDKTR